MSNFAERLVARSTGRAADAGVPLLMPRPVARFEPAGGPGAPGEGLLEDTGTVASGTGEALPDGTDPRAEAHLRDADVSVERTDRRRSAIRPTVAAEEAFRRPLSPSDVSSTTARGDRVISPPAAGAAQPTPEAGEPAAMPVVRRQAGGDNVEEDVEPQARRHARSVVASRQLAMGPAMRDAIAANPPPPPVEEQGGPAISIGKIEVQFLPKETPPGLPRTQPQRTRGFHAYDRARRGLR
jgi:hypothetical protein